MKDRLGNKYRPSSTSRAGYSCAPRTALFRAAEDRNTSASKGGNTLLSSSTSTPRRPRRNSPWAGIWTARRAQYSVPTLTCRRRMSDILPEGTAYITDVGMTGPSESVIGVKKEIILRRFLTSHARAVRDRQGVALNSRRSLPTSSPEDGRAELHHPPEPGATAERDSLALLFSA